MQLRFLGAGAIALALILAPDRNATAAGVPLVTGRCGCAIGWGLFMAKCGSTHVVCTRAMCAAACKAAMPKKSSMELTDVSAARRGDSRIRRAPRHHDGLGGRRYAGRASRTAGGTRTTGTMDIVHTDRDGRWGPGADRAPQPASPRIRPRQAALGPLHRHLRQVVGIVHRALSDAGGLPAELIAKVAQIAGACPGFHIISGFRPGAKVAGTNITSLHAVHRAADIAGGSYGCAYAQLQGWPGGASIDADRVAHIHLSWAPGSAEWGARFRHGGGGGHHSHRYARHGHARRG